jgi:predicted RNase H-like nuclease (RuvC/YqgF family)
MSRIEEAIINWAKDHYWDTLEKDKDLIIKHLNTIELLESEPEPTESHDIEEIISHYHGDISLPVASEIARLREEIDRLTAENKDLKKLRTIRAKEMDELRAELSLCEEVLKGEK